jgi:hypothetical protein
MKRKSRTLYKSVRTDTGKQQIKSACKQNNEQLALLKDVFLTTCVVKAMV